MYKAYKNGIELFHFDNLLQFNEIVQFVSTRKGGESLPPYDSLNFGLSSGDNPVKVLRNRDLLAECLGFDGENFVTGRQTHSDKVKIITLEEVHTEQLHQKTPRFVADAMVSDLPNFCLAVAIADCAPVLLYDYFKRVIAVAHAGWKGTVKKIVVRTVSAMKNHFNCDPVDIYAGIGPSIGPCCYEVGPEVIDHVQKSFTDTGKILSGQSADGHAFLNLWRANRQLLIEAGVPKKNIEVAEECTKCNPDRFFSYRGQGEKYGRLAAGILLKGLS